MNDQDFIDLWKNVNLTKEQEQSIIQRIKVAHSQPKESILSNMKLFDAVQNGIGNQLEKETSTTFTVTRNRRRSRFFGPGAAATAAVLIVAGSIYALSQNGSSSHLREPNVTAVSKVPSMPASSSIKSIYITSASQIEFLTNDSSAVDSTISAWLKSSKLYTGKIDESTMIQGTYVGPAQLHIDGASTKSIVIYPISHVQERNGVYSPMYQQNVVAYRTDGHTTYLNSPELYAWLKNDQWRTQFNVFGNPLFRTSLMLPNAKTVTTGTVTWKHLTLSLLVTSLPPNQEYAGIVGNHANIISHEKVKTSAGTAILVYFQRNPPATASGAGNAITNNLYVISYGSQYAYVIQAAVTGNVSTAKSELVSLLQGWKVPVS